MTTPKWNKEDANRAAKMGWCITCLNRIERYGDRFKSDDDAIEWVLRQQYIEDAFSADWRTIDNALFLCAKG